MSKPLIQILATLLVPCLILDPIIASTFTPSKLSLSGLLETNRIAFERQSLTLPNCSALFSKSFDSKAFASVVREVAPEAHTVTAAKAYRASKPTALRGPSTQAARQNHKKTVQILRRHARHHDEALLEVLGTVRFAIKKGLPALGLYNSQTQKIEIDVLAAQHWLIDFVVSFHELVHVKIHQKRGPPENPQQRRIDDIVATYFELERLFVDFPDDSRYYPKHLDFSEFESLRYRELVSDLLESRLDWREPQPIIKRIAAYVLGTEPSAEIVTNCLSLIEDLRWAQVLKVANIQPKLSGVGLGLAMKNALRALSPKQEKVLYELYVSKRSVKEVGKLLNNVTTSRVRQIKHKAIRRLRVVLLEADSQFLAKQSDEDVDWISPEAWKYRSNEGTRAISILAGLSHPVLPRVRENRETAEWETVWLDGPRLQDWIDEMSGMGDEQFLDALLPKVLLIAEGLEVLHEAHIVHGDVSAHNIILHGNEMVPTLIDWDQIGPSWGYSNDNFAMPDLLRDALIRRLNLSNSILVNDEVDDIFRKLETACREPSLPKPRFNPEVLDLVKPRGLSNAEFIEEVRHYIDHHGQSAQTMSMADPDAVPAPSVNPKPEPDNSQTGGLIPRITALFSRHLGGASSRRYRWAAGPAIEELIGFGSVPIAAAYGLHVWGSLDLITLLVLMAVAAGARWLFYWLHPGRQRGAASWISGFNTFIPSLVAYHFSFSGMGIAIALLTSIILHSAVNIVNDTVVEYPLLQWWWYRAMLALGRIIYRTGSENLYLARIGSQVQRTRNRVTRDIQRMLRNGSLKVDVERDPEDPSAFEEHFIVAPNGPPVLHTHFYHPKTNSMENGVNLFPTSSINEPYRLNTSHALVETGGSGQHFVDIPLTTDVQGIARLEQKVLRESKKSSRFRKNFRWPENILGRGVGLEASPFFEMISQYEVKWRDRTGSSWTDPYSLVTFRQLDDLSSAEFVPSLTSLEEFQSILKAWAYDWNETNIPYQVLMPSVLQRGPWLQLIRLMPKSILLNLGLISPEAHALWPYPWDAKAAKDIASWVRTVHRGRPLLVHGTREEFDELSRAMADRRNRFPMRRVSPSVLTSHSLERFFLILYQGLRLGGHPDDRMRLLNVFSVAHVFNLLKQLGPSHGLPLDWLESGRHYDERETLAAA